MTISSSRFPKSQSHASVNPLSADEHRLFVRLACVLEGLEAAAERLSVERRSEELALKIATWLRIGPVDRVLPASLS